MLLKASVSKQLTDQGEIRATGFNESVDNLYELLQEGKVYFVSQARVNIAKKQFSNVKNDYEIMFDRATEVSEVCISVWRQVYFLYR